MYACGQQTGMGKSKDEHFGRGRPSSYTFESWREDGKDEVDKEDIHAEIFSFPSTNITDQDFDRVKKGRLGRGRLSLMPLRAAKRT